LACSTRHRIGLPPDRVTTSCTPTDLLQKLLSIPARADSIEKERKKEYDGTEKPGPRQELGEIYVREDRLKHLQRYRRQETLNPINVETLLPVDESYGFAAAHIAAWM
jgi:hypothetical protein